MENDSLIRTAIHEWNENVNIPPFEAFVYRRSPWNWLTISMVAAAVGFVLFFCVYLFVPGSPSLSEWNSSTEFMLYRNF